jgi:2,3-bisphosphoglycerate-dependent phosphoglycerate mutase
VIKKQEMSNMPNSSLVTTIILVRHGERNAATPANSDPHLSAAGRARAKKLIHVVGESGITAIYRSHFARAKETAQPLATHLGLSTTEMDEPLHIQSDILSNHVGETVLVVGHSNTVPALIDQLGAGSIPMIDDSQFDHLFVVKKFSSGEASVTRLKYGNPS